MSAKWRPPTPDNRRRPSRRRQPSSAQPAELPSDELHADELHDEVQAAPIPIFQDVSQSEPVGDAQDFASEKAPARRSRRGGSRSRKPKAETDSMDADATALDMDLPGSDSDRQAVTEIVAVAASAAESWHPDVTTSDLGAEVAPEVPNPAPETDADRATPRSRKRTEADASPVEVTVGVPRGMARRVDAKLVRQVAQRALQVDGWTLAATLDIHIITDEEMREVNATRRGIDEVTDVLSFPLIELQPGGTRQRDVWVLPPDTHEHLGDVVISVERVEAQAEEGGHSKERELAYLTAHGVLHILGYDHETDEQRRTMRRREEEVLVQLGLRRSDQRTD